MARIALPSLVYRSSMWVPAMTSTERPITTSCTVDKHEPVRRSPTGPGSSVYDTLVPPAMACTPNSMISVIPSDTITIVIGDAPRRWNGA